MSVLRRAIGPASLVAAAWLCAASSAEAQTIGTLQWQLQPYCNVVTFLVVQQGTSWQLEGTDDRCGAPRRASARGLAFANPDGTPGFGFTIITAPGGLPVHVMP